MNFFVFDWWLLIGVSHLQEVGAAHSGLTVSFHMCSPSHVHLTLYMYMQLRSIMYWYILKTSQTSQLIFMNSTCILFKQLDLKS